MRGNRNLHYFRAPSAVSAIGVPCVRAPENKRPYFQTGRIHLNLPPIVLRESTRRMGDNTQSAEGMEPTALVLSRQIGTRTTAINGFAAND
jgi:hypothetical protein